MHSREGHVSWSLSRPSYRHPRPHRDLPYARAMHATPSKGKGKCSRQLQHAARTSRR